LKQRLPALTGVRFFAAFAVLLMHYAPLMRASISVWEIASQGRAGVCFFFILSGFILTYNYFDWFEKGITAARFRAFARARIARIYPMHVAALLLLTPIILFAFARHLPGYQSSPGIPTVTLSWLANLLLLEVYIPTTSYTQLWNSPAWSVASELFFYACFPMFIAMLARKSSSRRALICVAGVCFVIELSLFCVAAKLIKQATGRVDADLLDYIVFRMPFFRIWEFFIGCCLGMIFLRCPPRFLSNQLWRDGWLLATMIAVFLIAVSPWYVHRADTLSWYVLYTPVFAMMIFCLAGGKTLLSDVLEFPLIVLLGEASYSLYLLHWIPMTALQLAYGPAGPPIAVTIAAMIGCIALSVACLKLIEIPARRFLTRGSIPLPGFPVPRTAIAESPLPSRPSVPHTIAPINRAK
jgi:peptidoglycan/LPS O-acetylase OafA/YrhL